jgi:peptide/nickel transport system permease protein
VGTYLLRRGVEYITVLFMASVLIFFVLHLSPGGPFDSLRFSKGHLPKDYIQNLEKTLGLDQPVHVRYATWAVKLVQGDFGTSWKVSVGKPVTGLIQSRLGNTMVLMISSLLISLLIALIIGIFSAVRQYSIWDYLVTSLSFFGISMPIFWFGLMMMLIFALQFKEWGLPYLPVAGMYTQGKEADMMDRLRHLVLPVTVLSLYEVASWSRYIRSSMLEVLRQDYVRTARAKGLVERVVLLKHALRNALIPLITVVALSIPGLFGGAIITETIFAWPGMGRLFYDGIIASDWPLAMGILIISAVLVVVSNLLADVLYAVIDPRIHYA